MLFCYVECEHKDCKQVIFIDVDQISSTHGDCVLIHNIDQEICLRKYQGEFGRINKPIQSGSEGMLLFDVVARCHEHKTGKLPEGWLERKKKASPCKQNEDLPWDEDFDFERVDTKYNKDLPNVAKSTEKAFTDVTKKQLDTNIEIEVDTSEVGEKK